MAGAFGITGREEGIIGIENQILEIIKPVHHSCGGTVIIGQSSPGDNGKFKIVCHECGETAFMTREQRLSIILALLKGEKERINEKIIVFPQSAD